MMLTSSLRRPATLKRCRRVRDILFGLLLFFCVSQTLFAQEPSPAPPSKVVLPSDSTLAQQAAAALGRPVTNADIANAIKNSGLSAVDVRAKLQQAGYDPNLADVFFAPGPPSLATPSTSILQAM